MLLKAPVCQSFSINLEHNRWEKAGAVSEDDLRQRISWQDQVCLLNFCSFGRVLAFGTRQHLKTCLSLW